MLQFAPHFKKKGEKMALPFVLGLIIGGGAVYAYNNRAQLAKKINSKDLKAGLKKGEKVLSSVSDSLKTRAKRLGKNLKNALDDSDTKSAKTSVKASNSKANNSKVSKAKTTKPKTTRTRKPRVQKAQEPTLIPATTSEPNL